jgi:hypothetical protein
MIIEREQESVRRFAWLPGDVILDPRVASLFKTPADDDDDAHHGLLVSLHLDPVEAKDLVIPGGEALETLHITLCYCGDVEDLGDLAVARAIAAVSSIIEGSPPLRGSTTSLGRFDATEHSDGKDVIIAKVDIPGLIAFRERISRALTVAGAPAKANFVYLPHITLAYVPVGDVAPIDAAPIVPLSFYRVRLNIGDEYMDVPFRQSPDDGRAPWQSDDLPLGLTMLASGEALPEVDLAASWMSDHALGLATDLTKKQKKAISDILSSVDFSDVSDLSNITSSVTKITGDAAQADTIVQTEVSTAIHRGQLKAWQEAQAEGLIAKGARRRWITERKSCPECDDLDGKTATLRGSYPGGIAGPPLHPNCQCREELIEP